MTPIVLKLEVVEYTLKVKQHQQAINLDHDVELKYWPHPAKVISIHHHHHISVMELGHLLTLSGLTCPEAFSKFCHDSFCQLGNSVSLPWVIYYGAFHLHVV